MIPRVAILGCGPAGLMAAQAVVNFERDWGMDVDLTIFSRKAKSPMYGAQYLHRPIPGATPVDAYTTVDYRLHGSAEDYRRKVYGQMWDGTVSPEDYAGTSRAWDIRKTYDILWERFQGKVLDTIVEASGLRNLFDAYMTLVINSIPLNTLCFNGHSFGGIEVIAAGDAPELGIDIGSQFKCQEDTVITNGGESPSWYRISRLFGHTTVEWPASVKMVPVKTASTVVKPTNHNCDCWPDMLNVGRYGSWTKGVLSHHAYEETYKQLELKLAPKPDWRYEDGKTAQV